MVEFARMERRNAVPQRKIPYLRCSSTLIRFLLIHEFLFLFRSQYWLLLFNYEAKLRVNSVIPMDLKLVTQITPKSVGKIVRNVNLYSKL